MTVGLVHWEVTSHIREAAARVPTRHDRGLVEQVLARYVAGEARSDIAAECHVIAGTISLWVRQAKISRTFTRPRRVSDETIQRTVDAYHEAGSIRGAARSLGCFENNVRHLLRHHAPDVLDAPEDGFRPKSGDPTLDVEPLAQLLDRRVAAGALISKLAEAAGLPERRINAIRNREYSTVRLSTADSLIIAAGESLPVIYPLEADPAPELQAA